MDLPAKKRRELAWSQIKGFSFLLVVIVFQHWTGVHKYSLRGKVKWDGAEFNPIAIISSHWWKPKVLRFWQPFKDFKHGRQEPVRKVEAQLFDTLKVAG
jgi:hypothetical protein